MRAPVSICALTAATPQSGKATHSRHPIIVSSGASADCEDGTETGTAVKLLSAMPSEAVQDSRPIVSVVMRISLGLVTIAASGLLAGCGSDDPPVATGPARTVEVTAVDYAFQAKEAITIAAGETITFVVSNEGAVEHQMEVLTDANRRLGTTERIPPGSNDAVTVTFESAGLYRVICDIDDHRSLGQQAEFTVVDG